MNHYETVFILNPVLSDDQIKETVNAKEYWKTLLILSLIFFALEILLIKIIKL